jgi:hypothetical protein
VACWAYGNVSPINLSIFNGGGGEFGNSMEMDTAFLGNFVVSELYTYRNVCSPLY